MQAPSFVRLFGCCELQAQEPGKQLAAAVLVAGVSQDASQTDGFMMVLLFAREGTFDRLRIFVCHL